MDASQSSETNTASNDVPSNADDDVGSVDLVNMEDEVDENGEFPPETQMLFLRTKKTTKSHAELSRFMVLPEVLMGVIVPFILVAVLKWSFETFFALNESLLTCRKISRKKLWRLS